MEDYVYNSYRRNTSEVKIGNVTVGGSSPVSVQSMTNTPTADFEATYSQILRLEEAGCDIVRMAIPDAGSVATVYKLKNAGVKIPLVADIHFDYKLALACADAGIDKIRINPGNIGDETHIKAVADACRIKNIPIRIGVNSGSVDKKILAKYGSATAEALAESALDNIRALEKYDFENILVAVKSSDVRKMIRASRIVAENCSYPMHIGVTEAGGGNSGVIKGAIGIGALLADGIGDTIRVSLTGDPVPEVEKGRQILASLGLDVRNRINVISCPTCGRTRIDLVGIVGEFENRKGEIIYPGKLNVAIMGCAVNGPGEASGADIGLAGGNGEALIFRKGEKIRKVPSEEAVNALIEEINKLK